MAFLSSPDFRAPRFPSSVGTNDAFERAAFSCRARGFSTSFPATGFIACALTAALMGSTPSAARADAKTKKTAPQTCVAKTSNVASVVARPRVSSLHNLQPISASSRRGANSKNENGAKKTIAPPEAAGGVIEVVEALPSAPASHAAIRLAAAPETENSPKTTATETGPVEAGPIEAGPIEIVSSETVSNANQVAEPLTATIETSATALPAAASGAAAPGTGSTPSTETDSEFAVVSGELPAKTSAAPSRLYAPSIAYEGGAIIAQGTPEEPVRLESASARITAQSIRLDTEGKTVSAQGQVRVERQVVVKRYSAFSTRGRDENSGEETITETLQGEDFQYNYETRQGQLGATQVRLANFNISAESLVINGQKYTARNVVVRPGGLSEEERKIYGTPPFNLRAREFTVDLSKPAATGANVSDTAKEDGASVDFSGRAYARGASLYFKNTRLVPVPSAFLNRNLGRREQNTYQITPRVSTNSVDGILVTTKFYFPVARENPERLSLAADVGLSTKIGFRGGAFLESSTSIGDVSFGARINDIVDTQLTNRIELDRLPELQYRPPELGLFDLGGGRRAGLKFGFIAGDYRERFTDGSRETRSSRLQGQVRFTTRLARTDGPYLDLFARLSKYSGEFDSLRTAGFEVGYSGPLTSRLAGQFSYSAISVSGSTPFRFDEIEIRKELRATFDILLTPRYIIPIDLRYDVERGELRDKTIGLLRNYKTFAYGVTYQSARREVKLEIRRGF